MKLAYLASTACCAMLFAVSCSSGGDQTAGVTPPIESVIVINEGGHTSSNASITLFDIESGETQQDVFYNANNEARLGDVAQDALIHNGMLYVTLNGSGKMYAIDTTNYTLAAKLTELHSPRYILIASETRGYVTNINTNVINIFNPQDMTHTGEINLGGEATTDWYGNETYIGAEQMVLKGKYLYTNQWSYGTDILVIDTESNEVVQRLEVGEQPTCLQEDKNGNLWTLCNGSYWQDLTISKMSVNSSTGELSIEKTFSMPAQSDYVHPCMIVNKDGDKLFYLYNGGMYAMDIDAEELPSSPSIYMTLVNWYKIAQNPQNGDIYLTDIKDYSQTGEVYRFDVDYDRLRNNPTFDAGVIPSIILF